MSILGLFGRPRVSGLKKALYKLTMRGGWTDYLPGGVIVDVTKSRDPTNTVSPELLNPGLLMGKITSGGLYAPSIIGVLASAVSAAGTTVTVSAAAATELVRRIGATGTIRLVGPPTAGGTVATFTETYSAVNTSTGAITCSGLDADLIAGSFLCANDGTYLPKSYINSGYGLTLFTNSADATSTVEWPLVPYREFVDVNQIVNYPSDSSLKTWVKTQLKAAGAFTFSDDF